VVIEKQNLAMNFHWALATTLVIIRIDDRFFQLGDKNVIVLYKGQRSPNDQLPTRKRHVLHVNVSMWLVRNAKPSDFPQLNPLRKTPKAIYEVLMAQSGHWQMQLADRLVRT